MKANSRVRSELPLSVCTLVRACVLSSALECVLGHAPLACDSASVCGLRCLSLMPITDVSQCQVTTCDCIAMHRMAKDDSIIGYCWCCMTCMCDDGTARTYALALCVTDRSPCGILAAHDRASSRLGCLCFGERSRTHTNTHNDVHTALSVGVRDNISTGHRRGEPSVVSFERKGYDSVRCSSSLQ